MSAATTYTAIIRWRGPDSALQLETRHTGFRSPEEAALYANGIPPGTPTGLHLFSDGSAVFMLDDYTDIPCSPDQLTIWAIPANVQADSDVIVASDNDFEPVPPGELPVRPSAHGDYFQFKYGVLDANGTPLDVQIDWDDSGRLRVTVNPTSQRVQTCAASVALGVLPEA